MLLKQQILRQIQQGEVTLAFRRWRRPTIKAGGTLTTSAGILGIDAVDTIELDDITETDAGAAGYPDLASLHADLAKRTEGMIYRVALHYAGTDPRVALRATVPTSDAEFAGVAQRLQRWDRASTSGPWTGSFLRLIAERPEVRAEDLAPAIGLERLAFKRKVRQLKGLGLTDSLKRGYRLSARGAAVLAWLDAQETTPE